jgi:hypothetical protein
MRPEDREELASSAELARAQAELGAIDDLRRTLADG